MSDSSVVSKSNVQKNRRISTTAILVAGMLVLLILPALTNDYAQYILDTILVYGLVGLGFNIILGYMGQFAFANAAFFGVGAYATALGLGTLHVPFAAALPLSGIAGAVAGFLVAVPALRLRRYYLAIVTLTLGELLRWIYVHSDAVTGGSSGLAVPSAELFGLNIDTEARKYYVFLAADLAIFWITRNLLRSRLGRALNAVRQNELAAAALGIEPSHVVMIAFAWSGAIVGVAGSLFAVLLGRITPDNFDLSQLLLHFTIVTIGGLGSLVGSILGAALLTAAPELLRDLPGLEEVCFALLVIAVLLFLPRGLGGILAEHVPQLRDRFFGGKS